MNNNILSKYLCENKKISSSWGKRCHGECTMCKKDYQYDSIGGEYYPTCYSWFYNGEQICDVCYKCLPQPCKCRTCLTKFTSKTHLFKHLKEEPTHNKDGF